MCKILDYTIIDHCTLNLITGKYIYYHISLQFS